MNAMLRLAWTAFVCALLVLALNLVSEKLDFDHNAHFAASMVVLFLVSLTNREAIYHGRWPQKRGRAASRPGPAGSAGPGA
jgi:hypothetical protein